MSSKRCHRVKCDTKERAETIIFIMAQRGIGPLYPEFCGICRAWHAVRGKNHNHVGHHPTHDTKTRASGTDD